MNEQIWQGKMVAPVGVSDFSEGFPQEHQGSYKHILRNTELNNHIINE